MFQLPELPYKFDALEPYIDAATVEIHYTKHHAAYLKNLNTALEAHPQFFNKSIQEILADLNQIPAEIRTTVRNNGGGYLNHMIYWEIMGPSCGGEPKGSIAEGIQRFFGSFENFKTLFEKEGMTRFGSGWAWLSKKQDGSLILHSTPNQDSPYSEGLYPVMGVDVWEHAYYLKYQNRRAEYLSNWWNLVNWEEIERRHLHV